MIDHVQRVAEAVPTDVRGLAYLHDVLERSETAAEELYELGLTDEEWAVLMLLTRQPRESYAAYVMRIARADGRCGRIARVIKVADLDDHLRRRRSGAQFPNYAWARARILASQRARGEIDAASRADPSSSV